MFRTPVAFMACLDSSPWQLFFLQESIWAGANVQLSWDTLRPLTSVVTLGQRGHHPSCDSVQQLIINGRRTGHFGSAAVFAFWAVRCQGCSHWKLCHSERAGSLLVVTDVVSKYGVIFARKWRVHEWVKCALWHSWLWWHSACSLGSTS